MGWLFAKKQILQMDETVVIPREKPAFLDAWQDEASSSINLWVSKLFKADST
jgi:hypothetical protein